MKYIKSIVILLCTFSMLGAGVHKFYVSITKVDYNTEEASLQIITKLFIDDVEKVLNTRYQTNTHLNTKNETPKDRELLKKYILDKLAITVNGKPVTLDYLGIEYDIDVVKSYIEVRGVTNLKSIEVENTLLFDEFEEQQNIIHINVKDAKRSLVLDTDNPKGLLKF